MDFIESRQWRITLIILSSIVVLAFIASRISIHNYIITIVYLVVHLYQFCGIIISYFVIEYDDHFKVGTMNWLEVIFFMFFASPYWLILYIVNTTSEVYRDYDNSPFRLLIIGVPIPWFLVAILSPIFEDQLDLSSIASLIVFLIFYAYCSYAVMDRWMNKFELKIFPYLNPITWIAIPILLVYYSIRFKGSLKDIKKHMRKYQLKGKCTVIWFISTKFWI